MAAPASSASRTGNGSFVQQVLPQKACLLRIHRDILILQQNPLEGIFVVRDETNVNLCHALIIGPTDTPYENGLFYFTLEFPFDYPMSPPLVTLITTGGGTVRFNPNLYQDGEVCLSILGTWEGPGWSPIQNIGSVLLSIQSLLSDAPFYFVPGFEDDHDGKNDVESNDYNRCIRHETI